VFRLMNETYSNSSQVKRTELQMRDNYSQLKMGFWASIPAVARQVDARLPDPPGAVRSVVLPIPPKLFPAVEHPGTRYIRGQFVCALQRLD